LDTETAGLTALRDRLGAGFVRAIDVFLACRGKVVVTGVGKSGIVCRKIAATFSSTGTPAFFLHAGEGSHGDVGTVVRGDVLLAVSNSGAGGRPARGLDHGGQEGREPLARRRALPDPADREVRRARLEPRPERGRG